MGFGIHSKKDFGLWSDKLSLIRNRFQLVKEDLSPLFVQGVTRSMGTASTRKSVSINKTSVFSEGYLTT